MFREPTVIEMINNLDSQIGPLQTNQIDSTVKLEFGSNINYRQLNQKLYITNEKNKNK